MKNLLFYVLILVSGCTGYAQTLPNNTYSMPAGKKAVLKLPYAQNIRVKAWDKPELQFNTTFVTTSEAMKNIHTMDVQDSRESLSITTDFKKDMDWKHISCCWCDACDSLLKSGNTVPVTIDNSPCICLRIDYEILLPAGAALTLETISGDIEIAGSNGALRLKTISGFVDIARSPNAPADIEFKSVTGEIYTDFDITLDKNSSAYHKKVFTRLNGGGSSVWAETVSGDIFFRKAR